ncbi:YezD family protein [Prosthecobacter sp.]|uniref:YezD family protein n=1 Tax=Prosthecobacter sp. TaxID=1965333 RepID=UPI003785135C
MAQQNTETEAEPWIDIVKLKVAALRFGSVQIIVHEGRVTQVESTEKTRLTGELLVTPQARKA